MTIEWSGEDLLKRAEQFNHEAEDYRGRVLTWEKMGADPLDNAKTSAELADACENCAISLQTFAWDHTKDSYILANYSVSQEGKSLTEEQLRILIIDEVLGQYLDSLQQPSTT